MSWYYEAMVEGYLEVGDDAFACLLLKKVEAAQLRRVEGRSWIAKMAVSC